MSGPGPRAAVGRAHLISRGLSRRTGGEVGRAGSYAVTAAWRTHVHTGGGEKERWLLRNGLARVRPAAATAPKTESPYKPPKFSSKRRAAWRGCAPTRQTRKIDGPGLRAANAGRPAKAGGRSALAQSSLCLEAACSHSSNDCPHTSCAQVWAWWFWFSQKALVTPVLRRRGGDVLKHDRSGPAAAAVNQEAAGNQQHNPRRPDNHSEPRFVQHAADRRQSSLSSPPHKMLSQRVQTGTRRRRCHRHRRRRCRAGAQTTALCSAVGTQPARARWTF